MLETIALVLVVFQGPRHELCEAFLDGREHAWDLVGAYSLDQAQQAALHVLVVVSKELVDVLVEVLVDSNDHPLGVHLEQQQERQNGFAS